MSDKVTLSAFGCIRKCTVVKWIALALLFLWQTGAAQLPPGRIVRSETPRCHSDPPLITEMMSWFAWHIEKLGINKSTGMVTDSARLRLTIWIYSRIIKTHPDLYIAFGSRGLTYFRLGDYEHAFSDYQKALDICPEDAWTLSNIGYIYFLRGEMQHAETVYADAILYDPKFLDARRNLGVIFALQKRFGEAIEQWKEGLKIDPENAILMFYIGSAFKDSGLEKESEQWLERAYRINPGLKKE